MKYYSWLVNVTYLYMFKCKSQFHLTKVLRSVLFASLWSLPLHFNSVPFHSLHCNSLQFCSLQPNSVLFTSIEFISVLFICSGQPERRTSSTSSIPCLTPSHGATVYIHPLLWLGKNCCNHSLCTHLLLPYHFLHLCHCLHCLQGHSINKQTKYLCLQLQTRLLMVLVIKHLQPLHNCRCGVQHCLSEILWWFLQKVYKTMPRKADWRWHIIICELSYHDLWSLRRNW